MIKVIFLFVFWLKLDRNMYFYNVLHLWRLIFYICCKVHIVYIFFNIIELMLILLYVMGIYTSQKFNWYKPSVAFTKLKTISRNYFSLNFGQMIFFMLIYITLFLWAFVVKQSNNFVAKKTTELFVLFHKKKTKLVFLWPNLGQLCFKVLIIYYNLALS